MRVIDLNQARNERAQPDPRCIKQDDFGRLLYKFALEFEAADATWGIDLWAYDFEDAEIKARGMRNSIRVAGQVYGEISA